MHADYQWLWEPRVDSSSQIKTPIAALPRKSLFLLLSRRLEEQDASHTGAAPGNGVANDKAQSRAAVTLRRTVKDEKIVRVRQGREAGRSGEMMRVGRNMASIEGLKHQASAKAGNMPNARISAEARGIRPERSSRHRSIRLPHRACAPHGLDRLAAFPGYPTNANAPR